VASSSACAAWQPASETLTHYPEGDQIQIRPSPLPSIEIPGIRVRPVGSQFFCKPSELHFCHDTVNDFFRDGTHIRETFKQLASGALRKRQVEIMRVALHEGRLHSMSNRRLTTYRLLEMAGKCKRVKVEMVEKDASWAKKFTTQCQGDYVVIRQTGEKVSKDRSTTTFRHELLQPWR